MVRRRSRKATWSGCRMISSSPPCFCLTPDAYFRESISVARRLHSSCSDRVGTDRPARWYHPPAFLMSPSWRCRCACTQSQSGSPSCCWTHSCAFFQSPRSAHQSACKAGPTSGGGVVADTLLRNASIVVMIVDPLSLNDPRHGRQNYGALSEPPQVRRILAGICGGAPLQWRVMVLPERGPPGPLMIHDADLEVRAPNKTRHWRGAPPAMT